MDGNEIIACCDEKSIALQIAIALSDMLFDRAGRCVKSIRSCQWNP